MARKKYLHNIFAMFLSCLITFSCSVSLFVAHPQKAEAGIPTVDIAALIQELLAYIQDLADYAEQLYQNEILASEYVVMLEEMEQIYREYQHTLNQIEGLAAYLDEETWRDILSQVEIGFPLNPLDSHWDDYDVDIYTDEGVIDVDQTISSVYDRIRELEDVHDDINYIYSDNGLRESERERARRQFLRSREVTEQAYSAEVFKASSTSLKEAMDNAAQIRENLATDDESQLRTLQTMALQQELAMNINKAQSDIMLKLFEMSNQSDIDRKTRDSYRYDIQIMEMREVKESEEYIPDDSRTHSATF